MGSTRDCYDRIEKSQQTLQINHCEKLYFGAKLNHSTLSSRLLKEAPTPMEEPNCFYYLASVKGDDNGEFFSAKNRTHAVQSIREYFQQYSEFTYAEVWKEGTECEVLLDTLELNKGVSIHHVEYICAIDENDEPIDDVVLVDREHEYALQPTPNVQLDLSVWGLYKAFDN